MTIPISEHRTILQRAKLPVALALVAGLAIGLVLAAVLPTTYTSKSTIFISVISTDPTKSVESTLRDVDMETEARIAASRSVAERAADRIDGAEIQDVLDSVSAFAPQGSRVLEIRYEADSAEGAQFGAQAVAEEYLTFRTSIAAEQTMVARAQIQESIDTVELELTTLLTDEANLVDGSEELTDSAEIRRQVLISELDAHQRALAELANVVLDPGEIIDEAPLPSSPSSIGDLAVIIGSILAALIAALGFVYLREALGSAREVDTGDQTARPAAAEALPAVLAPRRSLDLATNGQSTNAALVANGNGANPELVTNGQATNAEMLANGHDPMGQPMVNGHLERRGAGIVMGVVSVDNSMSAAEVAMRVGEDLATAGQRTVLIDLGLGAFDDRLAAGEPGVSELATGLAEPGDTVHAVRAQLPLWVIAPGSTDVKATDDQLAALIEEASAHHEVVVLIGSEADARSLALITDAAQELIRADASGAAPSLAGTGTARGGAPNQT